MEWLAIYAIHRITFTQNQIVYKHQQQLQDKEKKVVVTIELSNQLYWYSKLLEKWIIGLQFHIWMNVCTIECTDIHIHPANWIRQLPPSNHHLILINWKQCCPSKIRKLWQIIDRQTGRKKGLVVVSHVSLYFDWLK